MSLNKRDEREGDWLEQALGELPRLKAHPSFHARIMAAWRTDRTGRRFWHWLLAPATVLLIIAVLWFSLPWRSNSLPSETLRQLREEHARIAHEIEAIRMAGPTKKALYLGSNDRYQVFLDYQSLLGPNPPQPGPETNQP